jgi:hypothetical protein
MLPIMHFINLSHKIIWEAFKEDTYVENSEVIRTISIQRKETNCMLIIHVTD